MVAAAYGGEGKSGAVYLLGYNPCSGEWRVSKHEGEVPVEGGGDLARDEERGDSLMVSAEEAGVPSHVIPSSAPSDIIDLTSSP
ncbi:transcriptional Sir2 family protein [Colletotrichum graminicola]|nr:transcriptional Sir2 family protein [Colletotrichum graminicola]